MFVLLAVNAGPLVWVSCFGTSQSLAMINLLDPLSQEKLSTRFDDQMFCIQRRSMSRRRFVPLLESLVGSAGCLGRREEDPASFRCERHAAHVLVRHRTCKIADQLADLRQWCSAVRWMSVLSTTGEGWGNWNAGRGVLRALSF